MRSTVAQKFTLRRALRGVCITCLRKIDLD
jgi:hypothetical protein